MKKVTVESVPGRTYALRISEGWHALIADEPKEDGGDDLGPTPYELLLASLGACMAITLTLYARRKEWPLEAVTIEVTHAKVFARDCELCTQAEIDLAGPQGRIDVIETRISVKGALSGAQVARLHEIAGRCPVHRTLEKPPKLVSTIEALPRR